MGDIVWEERGVGCTKAGDEGDGEGVEEGGRRVRCYQRSGRRINECSR